MKKFDLKTAVILMVANALIVGVINSDGVGGASKAALIQAMLTFFAIGIVVPYIRIATESLSAWFAYGVGAGILPALTLSVTTSVHKLLGTPHMVGTTIYLFVTTWVVLVAFVALKRNSAKLPTKLLRGFAQRL